MIPDMEYSTIIIRTDGPFAHVTMNRPDTKNALNRQMVADLLAAFERFQTGRGLRAIVLSGAGGNFCAGGDLSEMRDAYMNNDTSQEFAFEKLLVAANDAPQVVIARVEGAAMGGGLGLVCISDIAIASTTARMGLPEVRLGVAAAFISPYVIRRVGLTRARELMLTGRRFDGQQAREYGFVHDAVEPEQLDARVQAILDDIRQCSPNALAATKTLIRQVSGKDPAETVAYRAGLLAELRRSEEAQEGITAFLTKRPPRWALEE